MDILPFLFLFFIQQLVLVPPSFATRLKARMYHEFSANEVSYCKRYLTPTGMVGCSSSFHGSVGDVFIVRNMSVLNTVASNADDLLSSIGGRSSYVLVMNFSVFTAVNMTTWKQIQSIPQVVGLLLLVSSNDSSQVDAFSEDSRCPGATYSFYGESKQCAKGPWNPSGKEYFLMDWPFPIVMVDNEIGAAWNRIEQCHEEHNIQRPDHRRCALELRTHQDAVTSAIVCMRRQEQMRRNSILTDSVPSFCDSLTGSPNIYVHSNERVLDPGSVENRKRVTLVLTRMDTRSMFAGKSFGVRAVFPNLAVLLAVVKHLHSFTEYRKQNLTSPTQRQVIFGLLPYEAFDYLGSERLAYSLERHKFLPRKHETTQSPGLGFEALDSVLELGPIGSSNWNEVKTLFAHSPNQNHPLLKELSVQVANYSQGQLHLDVNKYVGQQDTVMPPSSVQPLLKRNNTLPVALVTDAEQSWTDSLLHSVLDRSVPRGFRESRLMSRMANALASLLYKQVTDTNMPKEIPEDSSPEEFFACLAENYSCPLFTQLLGKQAKYLDRLPSPPVPTLWDLSGEDSVTLGNVLRYLLIRATAETVEGVTKQEDCKKHEDDMADYTFLFLSNAEQVNGSDVSQCLRAPVTSESRLNPVEYRLDALEGEDGEFRWPSEKPSAAVWVSSTMSTPARVRLFLRPSLIYEALLLLAGLLITGMALGLALILSRKRDALFPPGMGVAVFLNNN